MVFCITRTPALKQITAFGFLAYVLLVIALTSCASLSPQQVSDNSVTRHEQRAEGIADPMKQK